jgi:hypothetical protein
VRGRVRELWKREKRDKISSSTAGYVDWEIKLLTEYVGELLRNCG